MSETTTESKLVAEALGTFMLTFIGAGAIVVGAVTSPPDGASLLTVAIAHGLALSIAVTATMNISGAHINPAVTLGFMATNRIDPKLGGLYMTAQFVGAIAAGGLLVAVFGDAFSATGGGTPMPNSDLGVTSSEVILLEAILTFLLVFAIWGTAVDPRAPSGIAGFGIGLAVAADILMGGPITGAAMNPARFLGTALFTEGALTHTWLYIVGPAIGALLGSLVYSRFLLPAETSEAEN